MASNSTLVGCSGSLAAGRLPNFSRQAINRKRALLAVRLVAAIWNSDAYCGGYTLNVGLEVTQAWLDSCSDGFLNCTSQAAAGRVWFYDHNTLGGKLLSHNQSRRQCFGLDVVLRNDL